ncbi:hypothetical protein MKW94_013638 [Papaver nudicaule]|uniref:dihydroorotase n=1 Tax=Papaver nudicaule TaxID=74823 RepID=A0AA41S5T5_PAPNU|nr:hypothetical protein [Papaver nudicaule]
MPLASRHPTKIKGVMMELSITQPDDWHLHLRDSDLLKAVVPHSANHFGRAIIMPNLKPPVTTTAEAVSYRESILRALPTGSNFTPLMTLYLTDNTHPDEIKLAMYPAGATTNSLDGVSDLFGKCLPVLKEMIKQNMPLLGYSNYCLPVLKREIHRQAIVSAVTSGSKRFFLGTDSAPHERQRKEATCGCAGVYNAPVALAAYAKVFEEAGALKYLEAFTSFNGPDFYGLPRNESKIKLIRENYAKAQPTGDP